MTTFLSLSARSTALLFAAAAPLAAVEYWVAPAGKDSAAGTRAEPFATIRHAVSRATTPGDTVTVRGGTYRGEQIVFRASGTPKAPITLQAERGEKVVLKGSAVLPPESWQRVAGDAPVYQAPWKHYFGAYHARFLDPDPKKWTRHRGDKPFHRFFADGAILEEVPHRDWLDRSRCPDYPDTAAGRFHIDKAAGTVFVQMKDGSNPAKTTFEGTTTGHPVIATWGYSHLVIRGLEILHLANGTQGNAAIRVSPSYGPHKDDNPTPSEHVLIEDVAIHWVAGTALSMSGRHHLVRRVELNDNGQNSLHVSLCHDSRFENITYLRNNRHPGKVFDHGWEAVMKVASSSGCVFDRIESAHNHGMGWWVDGPNNHGNVLQNSLIRDNHAQGVRIEIAYDTGIYKNVIRGNREIGLEVSASIGNRILHNTFVGNPGGGVGLGRVAKWDKEGYEMSSYANVFLNNIIVDNQGGRYNKSWFVNRVVKDTSDNLPPSAGGYRPPPYADNISDHNLFFLSPDHPHHGNDFFTPGGRTPDLATYQRQSGLDPHSKWGDPAFVNATGHDYRIGPNSAARGLGSDAAIAHAPQDLLGRRRAPGKVDAGAFQSIEK